jgi:hypothetical protein
MASDVSGIGFEGGGGISSASATTNDMPQRNAKAGVRQSYSRL